jgi:hypothetical protein
MVLMVLVNKLIVMQLHLLQNVLVLPELELLLLMQVAGVLHVLLRGYANRARGRATRRVDLIHKPSNEGHAHPGIVLTGQNAGELLAWCEPLERILHASGFEGRPGRRRRGELARVVGPREQCRLVHCSRKKAGGSEGWKRGLELTVCRAETRTPGVWCSHRSPLKARGQHVRPGGTRAAVSACCCSRGRCGCLLQLEVLRLLRNDCGWSFTP